MKINLGCCKNPQPGYVNVDRMPPADLIMDLEQDWMLDDNSVDELRASHIIEQGGFRMDANGVAILHIELEAVK